MRLPLMPSNLKSEDAPVPETADPKSTGDACTMGRKAEHEFDASGPAVVANTSPIGSSDIVVGLALDAASWTGNAGRSAIRRETSG